MKKKKKRSSKNLKISTRITLSTIFGILVPLAVVFALSSSFINTMATYFNVSTVTSNTYSVINQLQWNQTVSLISDELVSSADEEAKLKKVKSFVAPLEKLGSEIYIEQNSKVFYSTKNKNEILSDANGIVKTNLGKNLRYFSQNGMVIVSRINSDENSYVVLIANDKYTVKNEGITYSEPASKIFSRTGFVIILIALIFILSIVGLSFITSSTIVKPLKKLALGADEISRGNLDYVIDYDSTNEIGVTVDSFNEMTNRLRESLDSLRESEDSRREMIAGVAHDLRTPLTSAKGYVEGLRDGIADTPEKQERYLKTIYDSTISMEKLLDELLTVSKIETGNISLDLQKIRINDFLDDCVSYLSADLEDKGFDFAFKNKCSDDVFVMLDSDQFERVIKNIVSNSVKYAKKDVKGKIELSAEDYNKTVIISISDNGIGVAPEKTPKLFDSFYRADPSRSNTREGSGLGLYVCKQLVELHGGRIWATGKEGIGLTIHISLNKELQ